MQLDLFAETVTSSIEPTVPDDDSPACSSCLFYASKVIPIGNHGGLVGHAGDCSKLSRQVLNYATCPMFEWRNDEEREKHHRYLVKVGRA